MHRWIYKSDLTGHWIVDQWGSKGRSSGTSGREGFTTYEAARRNVVEWVDEQNRQHAERQHIRALLSHRELLDEG